MKQQKPFPSWQSEFSQEKLAALVSALKSSPTHRSRRLQALLAAG
jgi:hypothetical protein